MCSTSTPFNVVCQIALAKLSYELTQFALNNPVATDWQKLSPCVHGHAHEHSIDKCCIYEWSPSSDVVV